jgi:hypothetical protein
MTIANHNGMAAISAPLRMLAQQFLKFCLHRLSDQLLGAGSQQSRQRIGNRISTRKF